MTGVLTFFLPRFAGFFSLITGRTTDSSESFFPSFFLDGAFFLSVVIFLSAFFFSFLMDFGSIQNLVGNAIASLLFYSEKNEEKRTHFLIPLFAFLEGGNRSLDANERFPP